MIPSFVAVAWKWMWRRPDYMLTLLEQCFVSAGNFLLTVLIARFLGLESFGQYSVILVLVLLFEALLRSLVATPMMTLAPLRDDSSHHYWYALRRLQWVSSIVLGALTGATVYAGDMLFPQWNIGQAHWAAGCYAAARGWQEFHRRQAFALHLPKAALKLDIAAYGSLTGGLALLVWQQWMTPVTILFLGAACFGLASMIFHPKIPNVASASHPSRGVWKEHWRFGKWVAAKQLCQWLGGNYLLLLLGTLLTTADAGGIRAVLTLLGPLTVLFLALDNIMPVKAAYALRHQGPVGLQNYLARVMIASLFVTGLLSLAVAWPAGFWLRTLFGSEYVQYSSQLRGLACVILLTPLSVGLEFGLRALHQTRQTFLAHLANATLSLSFGPSLILAYGSMGYVYGVALFLAVSVTLNGMAFMISLRKSKYGA